MKNKTKVKLATAEKIKKITKIQEHRDSLNMEYYNGPTPIAPITKPRDTWNDYNPEYAGQTRYLLELQSQRNVDWMLREDYARKQQIQDILNENANAIDHTKNALRCKEKLERSTRRLIKSTKRAILLKDAREIPIVTLDNTSTIRVVSHAHCLDSTFTNRNFPHVYLDHG